MRSLPCLPIANALEILNDLGWFGVFRGHSRSLEIAPFDRMYRVLISVP